MRQRAPIEVMGLAMRMIWAGALTAWAVLAGPPCAGEAQAAQAARQAAEAPLELSSQARRRGRIVVTPYRYIGPGPGAVRHCHSWLAQEARPSGTVIVPRMRCWWEPG